jgi:DNA-binding NtrC family response regulator
MNSREDTDERSHPRSIIQKVLYPVIDRPWWTLIAVAAVTIGFGWALPQLHIATSVQDLVIENLRETAQYQAFKQVFESDEIIRIVITGHGDKDLEQQAFELKASEFFNKPLDTDALNAALKRAEKRLDLIDTD